MEIPTNYNIMLTAPAKTFSSIPRKTRASILVAATKSGTDYLCPSGYRWAQHHHSDPEATELLREWIHSPTVDASQTSLSIRCNTYAQIHVTLKSALQQVDHRTSERKRWWFNLFCLFQVVEFPGTVLVMDVTIALHLKTFHRPLRR